MIGYYMLLPDQEGIVGILIPGHQLHIDSTLIIILELIKVFMLLNIDLI